MNTQKLPSFWSILWISLSLGLIGWGGLVFLVNLTVPTLAPRWLFFFLLTLALSGTALPVTYFLNRRFQTDPPIESSVIVREAMLVGVYGSLLAWLQMGGVLTSGLVIVLAVGILFIELLLRLSERSQWSPGKVSNSQDDENEDLEDEDLDDEDMDD